MELSVMGSVSLKKCHEPYAILGRERGVFTLQVPTHFFRSLSKIDQAHAQKLLSLAILRNSIDF